MNRCDPLAGKKFGATVGEHRDYPFEGWQEFLHPLPPNQQQADQDISAGAAKPAA
jgi:hypothetical protein